MLRKHLGGLAVAAVCSLLVVSIIAAFAHNSRKARPGADQSVQDARTNSMPTVLFEIPPGWHLNSTSLSTVHGKFSFRELYFDNRDGDHEGVDVCLQLRGGLGCADDSAQVFGAKRYGDFEVVLIAAIQTPRFTSPADRELWRNIAMRVRS